MNIGMPSIIIKMLRNKFDQQWSVRKSDSTEAEQARILNLLKPANLNLDARLEGPTLRVQDLMTIEPGHILNFDHALSRPLKLSVNGQNKYEGQLVATRNKKSFLVEKLITDS
jgi:flagellar motor switch protein FliM